jgi:hypothetical protein
MVSSNLKRKLPNIIKPRNQNRILLFYKKDLLFFKNNRKKKPTSKYYKTKNIQKQKRV